MNDVFERATAYEFEYQIEMLLLGEHDAHELDHVRVAQITQYLGFFQKRLVRRVQLRIVEQHVELRRCLSIQRLLLVLLLRLFTAL